MEIEQKIIVKISPDELKSVLSGYFASRFKQKIVSAELGWPIDNNVIEFSFTPTPNDIKISKPKPNPNYKLIAEIKALADKEFTPDQIVEELSKVYPNITWEKVRAYLGVIGRHPHIFGERVEEDRQKKAEGKEAKQDGNLNEVDPELIRYYSDTPQRQFDEHKKKTENNKVAHANTPLRPTPFSKYALFQLSQQSPDEDKIKWPSSIKIVEPQLPHTTKPPVLDDEDLTTRFTDNNSTRSHNSNDPGNFERLEDNE